MPAIPRLTPSRLGDVIAGVTLAAVAIPEAMGYTKIAGMPVVTGIYTVLLPAAVYALVGSSRHLVVGADSATAAILFAGLTGLAATASPQYLGLASTVALLTGGFLLLARLLRLGFLADFLSRTALIGFLSGVGIQVAVSQLPDMLGIPASGDVVSRLRTLATSLGHVQTATVLVAVAVLIVVLVLERIGHRVPAALIALVASIIVAAAVSLESHGVRLVGAVAGGFPPLGFPSVAGTQLPGLAGISASVAVVVLAQSAATSRSFAQRHHENVDENRDLVGLSLAELAAGFSGTFPVNGSPTKTAVVDAAGGRTQLAQLVAAAVAGIVLLVATGLLRSLPEATLAAIVFVIGVRLVDLHHLRELARVRRDELVVALATMLAVIFAGVEAGIVLAVALSVLDYVRRGYRPNDVILAFGADPAARMVPVPAAPGVESRPGLLIYRFDASIFFANADHFARRLHLLVGAAPHPVHDVVIDLSPVNDIDYTAGSVLRSVIQDLRAQGIRVVLVHARSVEELLRRYGIVDAVGSERVVAGVHEAVRLLGQR